MSEIKNVTPSKTKIEEFKDNQDLLDKFGTIVTSLISDEDKHGVILTNDHLQDIVEKAGILTTHIKTYEDYVNLLSAWLIVNEELVSSNEISNQNNYLTSTLTKIRSTEDLTPGTVRHCSDRIRTYTIRKESNKNKPGRKARIKEVNTNVVVDYPEFLQHLIPELSFSKTYFSRRFGKFSEHDIFDVARASKQNVMLFGPTGPGKTSSILAYAASRRIPLVTIQCNQGIDPSILFGSIVTDVTGERDFVFQVGDLIPVIENGGIVYLDEVNFMPAKLVSIFNALLDKRRSTMIPGIPNPDSPGRGYILKSHENTMFFCAYNPSYAGTKPLNKAFANRFPIKLEFNYDPTIENRLITSKTLREIASKLRDSQAQGALSTPTSTNMLTEFCDHVGQFDLDMAVKIFVASFAPEEQSSVTKFFSGNMTALKRDFGV